MKTLLVTLSLMVGMNAMASVVQNDREERALIAYMKVVPGTEGQFLKAAENVILESRAEEGNIIYKLHQSVTNPEQFVFYELFKTDADLQYHRNAKHVKSFLKETKPYTVEFVLEEYALQ